MAIKLSNATFKSWEEYDYKTLLAHPGIELLRMLPHTKMYALLQLLTEIQEETFDMGYESGWVDATMGYEKKLSKVQGVLDDR